MAGIADVQDPKFRAALEEVDNLISEGDYTKAARKCAETYVQLLEKRPDFIVLPPDPRLAPQYHDRLPPNRSRGGGGTGGMGRQGWPNQGGIKVVVDEQRRPRISYEKEKFGFSEACYYFEFLMEEVIRDQREPVGHHADRG
ncbi:MAG TPA: hypothetical protein VNN21_11270 [Dehalococcoidia bacterium]|nr:hypothetical protein [Dehalococcoidia bacterium]